jgi:hypothetical protein
MGFGDNLLVYASMYFEKLSISVRVEVNDQHNMCTRQTFTLSSAFFFGYNSMNLDSEMLI